MLERAPYNVNQSDTPGCLGIGQRVHSLAS